MCEMVLVVRGCTWKDRRAAQVGLKSMAMRVVPGMHSRARRSVVHVLTGVHLPKASTLKPVSHCNEEGWAARWLWGTQA